MDQNQTPILDISSDDEVGFDDSSTADNFGWISKLLEDIPGEEDWIGNNYDSISGGVVDDCDNGVDNGGGDVGDDSDDVVVVGEVIVKPKKAKTSVPRCRDVEEDDDCVVLECDPDKAVAEAEGKEMKDSDGDSDDLLIVGETGQVACRDYPHSRHLCAKFPFRSTPHESHCDLCHCYVCDSLAPCASWGSGVSGIDHCHATDKEEYWQLERKNVRHSKSPPVPASKPPVASLARFPQMQQASARAHPVHRPASTHGISTTYGLPNIISQSRNQRPVNVAGRSRFQPNLVSRQLLRTCNSITQSNRSSTVAPNLVASRPTFKHSGFTARAGIPNRSARGLPKNASVAHMQQLLNRQLGGKPVENNSINLNINLSSCQPTASSISTAGLPSQLQGYCQPSVFTPTSSLQGYGIPSAITSDSPYVYTSGNQTQNVSNAYIPFSPSIELNNAPQVSHQPSVVTQNDPGSNFSCGASNVLSSITQRNQQPSEVTDIFPSPYFPSNTPNSQNSVAQNCRQPLAENSYVQGAVPIHECLPSMEQNSQVSGSTNSSSLDFDPDIWLRDNEPTLGAQEECYMFDVDNQLSAPAPIDTGMLYFDFDTSWKGLTHS